MNRKKGEKSTRRLLLYCHSKSRRLLFPVFKRLGQHALCNDVVTGRHRLFNSIFPLSQNLRFCANAQGNWHPLLRTRLKLSDLHREVLWLKTRANCWMFAMQEVIKTWQSENCKAVVQAESSPWEDSESSSQIKCTNFAHS